MPYNYSSGLGPKPKKVNDRSSQSNEPYEKWQREFHKITRSPEAKNFYSQEAIQLVTTAMNAHTVGAIGGTKSARLEVEIKSIVVTTATARAVLGGYGSDEILVADLKLVDSATGAVLAESSNFRAVNPGAPGSSDVGLLVAVAINSIDASRGKRATRLANDFAKRVLKWLDQK